MNYSSPLLCRWRFFEFKLLSDRFLCKQNRKSDRIVSIS
ncbi:hypothetical protein C789_2133 [Microcystis aeruginosa FACHB-905 = DIANCHI905]|uniref:Uncharacterized protein n=1 Tax=Microcystis aeruginosa PCC 7806SL TaxID=1903187 RepID=A0AB33BU85_MICA7|nr:hypothetical protein BH695_2168 [Microcystis aeruginosa PCC 7806SL]ELS48113.1 hypothetical protein C789_2133 [Microcystis aeruginosa FACHB-905 = DIANCHI905]